MQHISNQKHLHSLGSESLGVGALPTRGYAGGRCDLELSSVEVCGS